MKKICFILFSFIAVSVSASTLLLESFETNTVSAGALNGQNGWSVTGTTANVQSSTAFAGTQALEIQNAEVSHDLSSSESAIWLNFQARITEAPSSNPTVSQENTSVAFFVSTNLNLVVYSNTTEVTLSTQMPLNEWVRFDVYCDYNALTWDLSMNGSNIVAGLPLYSNNRSVESVLIANNSSSSVFVDDLDIADAEQAIGAPDTNDDGIPDWWQNKYMGGVAAGDPDSASANNGYTYRQAYIAGVSPLANQPFKATGLSNGRGLSWLALPGRTYDIQWASNLISGFTTITTVSDVAEYIDANHAEEAAGFYRLKARMDAE